MSDIHGEGYGDQHNWKRQETYQVGARPMFKGAVYVCRNCPVSFVHRYDLIPDIFEAIKVSRVPEKCKKEE